MVIVQAPGRVDPRVDKVPALPPLRTRRAGGRSSAVVQLVCVEIALLAVAGALFAGSSVALGVATGFAVLLFGAVFGRVGGRWWYRAIGAWWRLRRRRRLAARAATAGVDPQTAALLGLQPGLAIRTVVDRGTTLGVGQDRTGWFAVLELAPATELSGTRTARLSVDQLVRILDEAYVPISAVQLVSHRTPAPTALLDEAAPAVRSYRELLAELSCPMQNVLWLAVRLNPRDAAEAAASRGGGMSGVDRAFAAAVGRIGKTLAAADLPYRLLDADGLRQALVTSVGLDLGAGDALSGGAPAGRAASGPAALGGAALGGAALGGAAGASAPGEPRPVEQWSTWSAAGLAHAGYAVSRWPTQPAAELLAELGDVPAATVSVSVTVRPLGEHIVLSGLIRVGAPAARLLAASRQLTANAKRFGVKLRRMDGEQAAAVYAAAPTGGSFA